MPDVLGKNLSIEIIGQSHSKIIKATLFGMPKGIEINQEVIKNALAKRRPILNIDTSRIEDDKFNIVSGVKDGFSDGNPFSIEIENNNIKSNDYDDLEYIPRPGHADYVGYMKYKEEYDFRGGGFFSGRLTSLIVAISSVIIDALEKQNIYIGTHILKCGNVIDSHIDSLEDIKAINNKRIALKDNLEQQLEKQINEIKEDHDSIGGITETVIYNVPLGLGDKHFSSCEGLISKCIFGIGGIKGIEFGDGFEFANKVGSTSNDEFIIKDGNISTITNHNGGINGGITNGMPIVFKCVVKPTPSINKTQRSVNLKTKENVLINIKGRHDPAIIRRIPIVINSVTALAIFDLYISEFGKEVFNKWKKDTE